MSDLQRCARRVLALEKAIQEYLDAKKKGEMGDVLKADEKFERLMGRV